MQPVDNLNITNKTDLKSYSSKKYHICIDWLQFTIKNRPLDHVLALLNLDNEIPHITDAGLFGYNKTLVFFEKIKVMYRERNIKGEIVIDEDMGYHILLSGRACREYEQHCNSLPMLLHILFHSFCKEIEPGQYKWLNCNITRIDYAIDYFTNELIYITKLKNYVKNGQATSVFRTATNTEEISIKDGKTLGDTLYFGKPSSDIRIVFYDKLEEREAAGYEVNQDIDFWERCEIRMKRNKALESIIWLNTNQFKVGDLLCSTLRRYIQFRKKTDDKNKNRWPIFDWWTQFTSNCEPLYLSTYSIQSTLQQKKEYVKIHWTGLLSEIAAAEYENLDNMLRLLISNPKVDHKALARVNEYRISKGMSILSMDQYLDICKEIKNKVFDLDSALPF